MAIDAGDVKAGYNTSIPDAEIDILIAVVDEADMCLTAKAVAADKQNLLKTLAVRHMLALMENDGRGKATNEQAANGSGRSFQSWQGSDLSSTRFGSLLKQLDTYGCVTLILANTARVGIRSAGRRDPNVTRPTYGD